MWGGGRVYGFKFLGLYFFGGQLTFSSARSCRFRHAHGNLVMGGEGKEGHDPVRLAARPVFGVVGGGGAVVAAPDSLWGERPSSGTGSSEGRQQHMQLLENLHGTGTTGSDSFNRMCWAPCGTRGAGGSAVAKASAWLSRCREP